MATLLPRTLLALCLLMSACEEKKTPPPKPPATAKPAEKTDAFTEFYNEGNLQREKFAYREALTAYEKALALCDKVANPKEWSDTATQLALAYSAVKANEKYEALLREILAHNDEHFGKNSLESAQILDFLAYELEMRENGAERESLMRRAVAARQVILGKHSTEESIRGSDSRRLSYSLQNLGVYLEENNRFQEAEPILKQAFQVEIDCQIKTKIVHSMINIVQESYRSVLLKMGDTEEQAQEKIDKMMEPLSKK